MNRLLLMYFLGWLAYLGFSISLYPLLDITVMLSSIPLAMLGGWLYGYPGALVTILMTIPYHYLLLGAHAGALSETFNPFGIGTQLCFSFSIALLRSTQLRSKNLHDSLEQLVDERTEDLRLLAEQLIEAEQMPPSEVLPGLIDKPSKQLNEMRRISRLLWTHLSSTGHPFAAQAEEISMLVATCIADLHVLETGSIMGSARATDLSQQFRNIAENIGQFASIAIEVSEADWAAIGSDKQHHLCHIVNEAVHNATRHAAPSRILIGMEEALNHLVVFIENDGRPMHPNPREGMGIPLMRYRASKIGATLRIRTTANRNTRVECALPR